MHKLAQSVLAYIHEQDLIRPGHRVGIAVSGGADSVALLHLMLELKGQLGIVLSVVHVNHQLRGAESDRDEEFLCQLAEAHSLELFSESRDVRGFASENKLSLEAAARRLRYQFFEKLLLEGTLNEVATAHTLDDQAETVLLKLARGAGTRGLAGIYPKLAVSHQPSAIRNDSANRVHPSAALRRGDPPRDARRTMHDDLVAIVRPLLTTRRSTLRDYLGSLHQPWREDSSNRDLRHTRNRVRHGILPRFERHVNPNIRETLADAAEIARAEESYWQDQIANLLPQLWRDNAEGGTLDRERLKTFPLAGRRRLLRAAAELLGLNLEFRQIEELLALDRRSRSAALPNGWTATLQNNQLRFHKRRESPEDYAYEFVVPGEIYLPAAGITIQAIAVNGNSTSSASNELLDQRFAQGPLILRNWRPGERFWPAHTRQPRKIKELLQDRHISGNEKKLWPVLACGDEIVWLRGFGVRRDCVGKGLEQILIREFRTK